MFETIEHRARQTRATTTNYMTVPDIRTNMGWKAYCFRGPTIWNSLEPEVRIIENKTSFKNHITKIICRDVNHPG